MTQKQCILSDLLQGRKITPLDALNNYGCFRIGARINELRNQGYDIVTEYPKKGKRYAIYSLKEKK
jgi:hypothetical protein